jgi:hypothetical protein
MDKVVGNGTIMYAKFHHDRRVQGLMGVLVLHRMTSMNDASH